MWWLWALGALAAGAVISAADEGDSRPIPKPKPPAPLPPPSVSGPVLLSIALFAGLAVVVGLTISEANLWPLTPRGLGVAAAVMSGAALLCISIGIKLRRADWKHHRALEAALNADYQRRLDAWRTLEDQRQAALAPLQEQAALPAGQAPVDTFIEGEIQRRLRELRDSIAPNDREREELLAQVAMHELRMRRAVDAMHEYFHVYVQRLHVHKNMRRALADAERARQSFTNHIDGWFRHFLSQVDSNGVYRAHDCLSKWPVELDTVPHPLMRLSLRRKPTPEELAITAQRERFEQLQRERDALDHERRELQRRLAALETEASQPDSLDEFQRSLDEFAGPDADAAERAEVWVQQRVEQFAELLPADDPNRRIKSTRFEKKLRDRADVALEAWRKQREEAIGGEA